MSYLRITNKGIDLLSGGWMMVFISCFAVVYYKLLYWFYEVNNGENGQGSRYCGSKQVGESTFSICLKCRWRKLPPPIISKDIIIHLRIIMQSLIIMLSLYEYLVTIFINFETCGSNLIIPLKGGISYGDPALLFHSLQFLNGPSSDPSGFKS